MLLDSIPEEIVSDHLVMLSMQTIAARMEHVLTTRNILDIEMLKGRVAVNNMGAETERISFVIQKTTWESSSRCTWAYSLRRWLGIGCVSWAVHGSCYR